MKKLVLVACLLLFGCKQATKNIILYEEDISERISGEKILIENLDRNQLMKCSEVFDSIRFIPLETQDRSLIGNIDKIIATNDRFIILDSYIAKSIFVFDKNGMFMNRVGTNGNGPEEYDTPQDIVYDRYNNELLVWCHNHKTIMRFELDGKFIENIRVDWWASIISVASKDIYTLYFNNIPQKGRKPNDHNIYMINGKGQIINRLLPYNEKLGHLRPPCQNAFSLYRDTILYTPYFENKIYQINPDRIDTRYYVDFVQHSIPSSLLLNDFSIIDKTIIERNYANVIQAGETSSHIILRFVFDHRLSFTAYYSKESKQVKWSPLWINDVYAMADIGRFQCIDEDLIINSVESSAFVRIKDVLEKVGRENIVKELIRATSSIDNILFVNKQLKDNLIKCYQSLQIILSDEEVELINSINETDNPILMIAKLKKF